MDNNEHIDKHLKETLRHFEIQPRLSSFETIQRKMEKKKRRRLFLWFFAGCAALSGGILMYRSGQAAHSTKQEISQSISIPSAVKEQKKPAHEKTGIASEIREFKDHPSAASPSLIPATDPSSASELPETTPDEKPVRLPAEQNINTSANTPVAEQNQTSPSANPEKTRRAFPEKTSTTKPAPVISPEQLDKTDSTFNLQADHLNPVLLTLPYTPPHLTEPAIPLPFESPLFHSDSTGKTKAKRFRFLIGLNYDPQLVSYQLSKNKHHDPVFDQNYGRPFSELYLKDKRRQNTVSFGNGFGLKLGLVLSEKWEILAGAGFLKYKEAYRPRRLTDSIFTLPASPGLVWNGNEALDFKAIDGNVFRYYYYSLEAARYFTVKRFTKVKAGVGLKADQRILSWYYLVNGPDQYYYVYSWNEPLRHWTFVFNAKFGFIQDLGKRMQFHVSPSLFYTLNSMYNRTHVIKQRPYGLALECLLLFRLN